MSQSYLEMIDALVIAESTRTGEKGAGTAKTAGRGIADSAIDRIASSD